MSFCSVTVAVKPGYVPSMAMLASPTEMPLARLLASPDAELAKTAAFCGGIMVPAAPS
jgi:hypothetical protein